MRFFQSPIVAATMGAALVAAAPTTEIDARGSCTFNTVDQLKSGKSSCSTITLSNIHVPAGETLDLTDLKTGATVIFDGTTTFGYKEWKGPLISASGQGITIKQNKGARLDGGGQRWWDSKGSNGGKTKPKFFAAHKLQQSSINGLQIYNTPVQGFSILSDHLNVNGVTINNSEGKGKGHNTDAFDVSQSSWITIDGATVYNQDDCLAINSGEHITFTNGYCNGGHGISIGSVGGRSDNAVSDVTLSNSHVVDSATGTRIKTIYNAQGSVTGVKYQNIILENISEYGIIVEQDYENGKPTGRPTNGVKIEDITFEKVVGTVDKKGTNIYILCGEGSCSNWTWTGNNITGGRKSTKCENVPNGASC